MPLLKLPLYIHEVPAGKTLIRVHWSENNAYWWGPKPGNPPTCRFDAPAGQYRTLYAGFDHTGAFAESVLHTAPGKSPGQAITQAELFQRSWTKLRTTRPLRLAKFSGEGLHNHGLTTEIVAGPYSVTQPLALEVFDADRAVDGIYYRCNHNNDHIAVALFDRVTPADLETVETKSFKAWGEKNWRPLLSLHGAKLDGDPPLSIITKP